MVNKQTVTGLLKAERSRWGVSRWTTIVLLVAPFAGALIVLLMRFDLGTYRFVTAEDSVVEWAQFALFACGFVFGLLLAHRLLREGWRLAALAYLVFALGCLVVAGEEIAWGQRLLGFGTPEELAAVNMQGETTVHNIGTVQSVFHGLELVIGFYGSVVALLVRARLGGDGGERMELFVPPLFLASGFFLIFAYRAIRLVLFPTPGFTIVKYGEWPELCFAAALAGFAFYGWRRVSRRSRATAAAVAGDASVPGRSARATEA